MIIKYSCQAFSAHVIGEIQRIELHDAFIRIVTGIQGIAVLYSSGNKEQAWVRVLLAKRADCLET